MPTIEAVLESSAASSAAPWPVADVPAFGWVVLSGRMTGPEVGTVLATVLGYDSGPFEGDGDRPGVEERVRALIGSDQVVAPGGLRVRDDGVAAVVVPGCCSGLEWWREWFDLAEGGEGPWLGHDPAPWFERDGPVIRLWQDSPDADRPSGPPVELLPERLSLLLAGVRQDLVGFLDRVEEWAERHVPALAAALVAKLDADLHISTAGGSPA